jgi:lactate dehydrogenase-like 2-hydroxyacid dehydrogenase
MKIAVFSTRSYDREFLSAAASANAFFRTSHHFSYYDVPLQSETLHLTKGYDAICAFVNDQLDRATLESLKRGGVQMIALRCAGYNNVDLTAANELGIAVARVPAYSPQAVAEHTVALILMKNGAMLINTSRGGLIDTQAVIDAVKTGKIGYLGLDVYEEETELFFNDRSLEVIPDDVFSRLLTLPNVVVTGHQGFLTKEALEDIAQTTLNNIVEYATTGTCRNQVQA